MNEDCLYYSNSSTHFQKESSTFLINLRSRKIFGYCSCIDSKKATKCQQRILDSSVQVFSPAKEHCIYSVRTFQGSTDPSTSVSYILSSVIHPVDLQKESLTALH